MGVIEGALALRFGVWGTDFPRSITMYVCMNAYMYVEETMSRFISVGKCVNKNDVQYRH